MSIRKAVCEWKGIEFLPVVHQLVEERLSAMNEFYRYSSAKSMLDESELSPDLMNAKVLHQRWATYSDINPQQRLMLHSLGYCLKELEKKLGDISALAA